jgi:hypothetical protein
MTLRHQSSLPANHQASRSAKEQMRVGECVCRRSAEDEGIKSCVLQDWSTSKFQHRQEKPPLLPAAASGWPGCLRFLLSSMVRSKRVWCWMCVSRTKLNPRPRFTAARLVTNCGTVRRYQYIVNAHEKRWCLVVRPMSVVDDVTPGLCCTVLRGHPRSPKSNGENTRQWWCLKTGYESLRESCTSK